MAGALLSALAVSLQNPSKTLGISPQETPLFNLQLSFKNYKLPFQRSLLSSKRNIVLDRLRSVSSKNQSATPLGKTNYEFQDAGDEVELRLDIGTIGIESSSDIFVDADGTSLLIRVKASGTLITLMEISRLFEKIKPTETIWYIDEEQLVVNLQKCDKELKWPDVMECWESLTSGVMQLLKGTSIYLIGDSTEINQKVSTDLALGLGYTPLSTSDLLESYAQQSIASYGKCLTATKDIRRHLTNIRVPAGQAYLIPGVISEGEESVAEAEASVLEGLSSHVRTVVATLGGKHGAGRKHDKWRHLHAGFTVWLSKSEAADEASAKEEARRHIQDGNLAYSNADVVVKLSGWDLDSSQVVAQACLSALKQLILSDKQLTGKKSLYIRLGCRGDWPNIKPPGWDPASKMDPSLEA